MRDDVDLVSTYLASWEAARGGDGRVRAAHRRAVQSELVSLARHILPGGREIAARYEGIDAALARANDEAEAHKALDEERTLVVDDVLPFLIGSLEDEELKQLHAEFERARRTGP